MKDGGHRCPPSSVYRTRAASLDPREHRPGKPTHPEPTRQRYEKFIKAAEGAVTPLIEVFNLPETGEMRLMFNSDFASPQLPVLRKLFEDHGLVLKRATRLLNPWFLVILGFLW